MGCNRWPASGILLPEDVGAARAQHRPPKSGVTETGPGRHTML